MGAVIDSELVGRFNAGDSAAFVEIVERHRAKIQTVAHQFLKNHADAEEITQDTFVRAYRGLKTFRGESSLATWLYRIAFNLSRNRYWHYFRRGRHLTNSLDAPLGETGAATIAERVATPEADPARQATQDEFVALVSGCMEQLGPDQREILTLRNLLHRSYDEIAHSLGTNVGTVKSRIARARQKLRGLMVAACPEFSNETAPVEWFESPQGIARAT